MEQSSSYHCSLHGFHNKDMNPPLLVPIRYSFRVKFNIK